MLPSLVFVALMLAQTETPQNETPKTEAAPKADVAERSPPNLHPAPPTPVTAEELNAAITRGVDFLVRDQNKDGSWGSAERTKNLNIWAEVGSHHAFRTAVTAKPFCSSSLMCGRSRSISSSAHRILRRLSSGIGSRFGRWAAAGRGAARAGEPPEGALARRFRAA